MTRTPLELVEPGTVVRDPAMLTLYEQVGRAARSPISVLILGETGAGKEVLARTLHARSARAPRPYLELNCAALAPSLLEGERASSWGIVREHTRSAIAESGEG